MKRSILTALATSVLLWCAFTGFGYLKLGVMLDTSVQFSRAGFWLHLFLSLAPYLVCGVIAAVLRVGGQHNATCLAALIYLAAAGLAVFLTFSLRLPVYHDGNRVYGTNSIFMPPIESAYLLFFFSAYTFSRGITKRRRQQ